jgi:hypothetical protein
MALADVAEDVGDRTDGPRRVPHGAGSGPRPAPGDVRRADTLGREAVSLAEQTDSTDLRAKRLVASRRGSAFCPADERSPPFEHRAFRLLDRKGASAQAARVFRNLSAENPIPPYEDGAPDVVPEDEYRPAPEIVADPGRCRRAYELDPEPTEPAPRRGLRRRSPRRKRPRTNQEPSRDEPGSVADDRPTAPADRRDVRGQLRGREKKRGRFRPLTVEARSGSCERVVGPDRVAVIGAGVIGSVVHACARELAGAGVNVTLLEAAEAAGRGSSALANGGIRAQFTTEVQHRLLAVLDRRAGEARADRRGPRIPSDRVTSYSRARTPSERRLRDAVELQRRVGVETRWLEPDEIASMVPFVRAEGIRGGTFHARDGFLDPAGLLAALLAEARTRGATIVTRAAAERDRTRLRRPAREG